MLTSTLSMQTALQSFPCYGAVVVMLVQTMTCSAKLARKKRQMARQQLEDKAGKWQTEHLMRLGEREKEEKKDGGKLRAVVIGEGVSRTGTHVSEDILEESENAEASSPPAGLRDQCPEK